MIRSIAMTGVLLVCVSTMSMFAQESSKKVFQIPVHKTTLKNGLDVLILEMPEFKNVLSVNMIVHAGSRNEIEKGKTGFAHLFEHIMFRHKFNGVVNGYDQMINLLGAHNNAFTSSDITFYHPLTFTANMNPTKTKDGKLIPGLFELEASRFSSLSVDENIFKTEAATILGEYRKAATNPGLKIEEKMLELMYPVHSYGHTVIGYYDDVVAMPALYQYALEFYKKFYRPNNCVLVIAGDIKQKEILSKIEHAYGSWQPAPIPKVELTDPVQTEEKRAHVDWNSDVPPQVHIAYKAPQYEPGSKWGAVGSILAELLASEAAPLYKKLRYEKKTVTELDMDRGIEGFDPRPMDCSARLFVDQYKQRGKAYLDEVGADIIAGMNDLKRFSAIPDAANILETVKNKWRYDFLARFNSPANVAQILASYYRYNRDPNVLNKLADAVINLQPADIDEFAQKYFVDTNRVVVTMSAK